MLFNILCWIFQSKNAFLNYNLPHSGDFLLHFSKYLFPSKVDSFWIVGLDTMIGFLKKWFENVTDAQNPDMEVVDAF